MNDTSNPDSNTKRKFLRHTVATLAYRGANAISNAPAGFDKFRSGDKTRTPGEILAHIGDLFDWTLCLAQGAHNWSASMPLPWDDEVERFFASVKRFDDYLASNSALGFSAERLFQGPIADALTHVGQIAMLRRMAGAPITGENYFKAEIDAGEIGAKPSTKRVEFD